MYKQRGYVAKNGIVAFILTTSIALSFSLCSRRSFQRSISSAILDRKPFPRHVSRTFNIRAAPLFPTMKTTRKTAPPRAPWRDIFETHLAEMPAAEFSLATVSASSTDGRVCPRVRTCIFRSFWAELKLRDSARAELEAGREAVVRNNETARTLAETKADGGQNPAIFESDMLSFTTDVRMGKVGHIMSGDDNAENCDSIEVECVFWVKAVSTQWRLKGRAYAVGGRGEGDVEKRSRKEIWKWTRLRPRPTEEISSSPNKGDESWSWEKEITAHFANMSPIMRGSFKNPPPGQPRSKPVKDPSLKLGQKVYDLHDPVARSNFRVVVVQPTEVEFLDLTDPENGKRVRWNLTFEQESEEEDISQWRWEEEEVWP